MIVKEGGHSIAVENGVFYNPKMKGLRDISVAFLKSAGAEGTTLLDSTSATGIRGIRYSDSGVAGLTFLDISEKASENTKRNVKRNNLEGISRVFNKSIQEFAHTSEKFDIIDLDPFGSPMPYMNDIMKLSKGGTIMMVTATDTAVLCGAHPKACIKSYDARPLHNELCKEVGIRILMGYAIRIAAKFNFGVDVLMVLSDMHYMRIFYRMRAGAENAVASMKEGGFGAYCNSCGSFGYSKGIAPAFQQACSNCGKRLEAFGPLYLGRLYDKRIVGKILENLEDGNARKIIEVINDELDIPFFYNIPKITKLRRVGSASPAGIMSALGNAGHRCSPTQFSHSSIKTAAGIKAVEKALRSAKDFRLRAR